MTPPDHLRDERPSISVVVPVFNSEGSLDELVGRLESVLGTATDRHEILLVNDGSADASWNVVESLAAAHSDVRGIDLTRNFGQHNALLAGIRVATCDVIVTIDDDLQHRPEDIPAMLSALGPDVDLVYGVSVEEEHGLWRNLTSRIVKATLAMAIGSETARIAGAFRVFRTSLRDSFAATDDPYVSIDVLLSWVTTRVASVDVEMQQRPHGTSTYTTRKLVRHALNMMTGYGTAPLRMVTYLGFGFAVFGLAIFLYVVTRFFIDGDSVPGFPFLASLVAILSGVQLFALGMIGEYLGRIHFRSMHRPPYAVRRTVGPVTADRSSTQ